MLSMVTQVILGFEYETIATSKTIQYEYNIKRKAFYRLDQPVSKVH